jgi:hypothetical protein
MASIIRLFDKFITDPFESSMGSSRAFRNFGDADTIPPELMKPELVGGERALSSFVSTLDPIRADYVNNNIKLARDMLRRGQDNEDILARTGFWFDEKNQLKYEIDDSKAELMIPFEELKGGQQMLLGDLLKHDKFFQLYPDMADVPLKFYNGKKTEGGSFNLRTGEMEINLNSPSFATNHPIETIADVLHEAQHAIQKYEKFSQGGSKAQFLKGIKNPTQKQEEEAFRKYLSLAGEAEARNVALRFSAPKNAAANKILGYKATDETKDKNFLQTNTLDEMSQRYNINPAQLINEQGQSIASLSNNLNPDINNPMYANPFERTIE